MDQTGNARHQTVVPHTGDASHWLLLRFSVGMHTLAAWINQSPVHSAMGSDGFPVGVSHKLAGQTGTGTLGLHRMDRSTLVSREEVVLGRETQNAGRRGLFQ